MAALSETGPAQQRLRPLPPRGTQQGEPGLQARYRSTLRGLPSETGERIASGRNGAEYACTAGPASGLAAPADVRHLPRHTSEPHDWGVPGPPAAATGRPPLLS